jgi:glyoxylase-like metal-dependent hydrolase (beta-lactamase superfamily II)
MKRMIPAVVLCSLAGCGLHSHVTQPLTVPPRAQASWEEVFAHPTALEVTGFHTGDVWTGPEILIERNNPATPEQEKVSRWVPSLAYLVQHPTQGALLFDSGVREGECSYGARPFYWVPCRAIPGASALAQLRAHGLRPSDLRFVVLSHFHGDHVSGLADLVAEGPVRVLSTGQEWAAVNAPLRLFDGYLDAQVELDYPVTLAALSEAPPMPILGPSLDLFGDGSVWLFSSAGHTRGQLSVLLNAESGPVLLTFDASHLAANFEHRVPPGVVVDRGAALAALDRLSAFARAYPRLKVIYGHEPSQWPAGVVQLDLAGPSGHEAAVARDAAP